MVLRAKKTTKGFLPHQQLGMYLTSHLLPKHPALFQSSDVSGTLLSLVFCPLQVFPWWRSFMLTIYRITRVVLLLSNKYNKSSEVLSELSKERHQALWPNGLLCTATGNALDSTHTNLFLPFWDTNLLLFKVLSLPQIDLNLPREETLMHAGCSSTPLCSLSHQHTSQQDLFACAKRTVCSSSRGRWLNSKAGSKKDQIMAAGITQKQNLLDTTTGNRREKNKGFVPCAAHFRHMIQLSSLAYQSQSLPECMPGYFNLSIKASSPSPSETVTLLFLSQALC